MTTQICAFAAAAVMVMAGSAMAAVTFTDTDLGTTNGSTTSKSYTKDGVTINVTTVSGSLQHIPDGQYAGLWFSQSVISDAVYTIDFNGVGTTMFEFAVDAMSGSTAGAVEMLSEFSVTGTVPSFAVSNTSNVNVSGVDLASLAISCVGGTDDGMFTATFTSATPFTSISFRHTQGLTQNGSVIERITVDAVPAPGSLALLGMTGLAALRRRR